MLERDDLIQVFRFRPTLRFLTEADCVDYKAKAHSIPIARICRNRQRFSAIVLIENASDWLLDRHTRLSARGIFDQA